MLKLFYKIIDWIFYKLNGSDDWVHPNDVPKDNNGIL